MTHCVLGLHQVRYTVILCIVVSVCSSVMYWMCCVVCMRYIICTVYVCVFPNVLCMYICVMCCVCVYLLFQMCCI